MVVGLLRRGKVQRVAEVKLDSRLGAGSPPIFHKRRRGIDAGDLRSTSHSGHCLAEYSSAATDVEHLVAIADLSKLNKHGCQAATPPTHITIIRRSVRE